MLTTENETTPFISAFDAFVSAYVASSDEYNKGLVTYFEKQWLSPCVDANNTKDAIDGQEVAWQPVLRERQDTLKNLEDALEIHIPDELQQLFCRYYSHDLNAQTEQGKLTILQVWNPEDFDRLQKNLIAHVLMKRRLKQADTLFFALTDEEDFILSVMLSSGAVMLEKVGKAPQQEIASSLTDFMTRLSPSPELVSL